MKSTEKRLQEAFDAITLPSELKEATLERIEAERLTQAEQFTAEKHSGEFVKIAPDADEKPIAEPLDNKHLVDTSSKHGKTIRSKRLITRRLSFALAACLIFAFLGFGAYGAYAFETATVELELNPSLELGINRFDIVVDTRALNEDGQKVLDENDIIGMKYQEALAQITGSAVFQEFIDDESFLDLSVVCDDNNQAGSLVSQSDTELEYVPCEGACNRVSSEVRQGAQAAGMGIARYEAAQILMGLDPNISLDDCQSMTMRELSNRIAALDPDNDYAAQRGKGQGGGTGQGSGQGEGTGQGAGQGGGTGQGSGSGQGSGQSTGQGSGTGHGANAGQGADMGSASRK